MMSSGHDDSARSPFAGSLDSGDGLLERDDGRLRRGAFVAEHAGLELVREVGDHGRAAVAIERRISHPADGRVFELGRQAARLGNPNDPAAPCTRCSSRRSASTTSGALAMTASCADSRRKAATVFAIVIRYRSRRTRSASSV